WMILGGLQDATLDLKVNERVLMNPQMRDRPRPFLTRLRISGEDLVTYFNLTDLLPATIRHQNPGVRAETTQTQQSPRTLTHDQARGQEFRSEERPHQPARMHDYLRAALGTTVPLVPF